MKDLFMNYLHKGDTLLESEFIRVVATFAKL